MFVCCEFCVLLGRCLCDELITRPEESYRLWCVIVCHQETSRIRRPWPALGRSATKQNPLQYYLPIRQYFACTVRTTYLDHLILHRSSPKYCLAKRTDGKVTHCAVWSAFAKSGKAPVSVRMYWRVSHSTDFGEIWYRGLTLKSVESPKLVNLLAPEFYI